MLLKGRDGVKLGPVSTVSHGRTRTGSVACRAVPVCPLRVSDRAYKRQRDPRQPLRAPVYRRTSLSAHLHSWSHKPKAGVCQALPQAGRHFEELLSQQVNRDRHGRCCASGQAADSKAPEASRGPKRRHCFGSKGSNRGLHGATRLDSRLPALS